jgi:hypothetical protein
MNSESDPKRIQMTLELLQVGTARIKNRSITIVTGRETAALQKTIIHRLLISKPTSTSKQSHVTAAQGLDGMDDG